MHSISFQTFFVWAFKIVVDAWKFGILLLYILWDNWPIFRIPHSNEQLQQQLEYTLLKPDCHCWWISKMQSGREDTLEEWYAIKFCFKFAKNATEMYGMLQTAFWTVLHESSISFWVALEIQGRHGVSEGWWDVCGTSKEVNTPDLIGQRVRVTMLFTVPVVQTLLPVTFGYSLSSQAVVMRQLRVWKRLWRRSLTRSHKRTSMRPSRSCWNDTTSALQSEEITLKGTRVSCVYYQ